MFSLITICYVNIGLLCGAQLVKFSSQPTSEEGEGRREGKEKNTFGKYEAKPNEYITNM